MKKFLSWFAISFSLFFTALDAHPLKEPEFKSLKFLPPKIESHSLQSGATLFMLEDHELPLVQLTALVRTGTMFESEREVGLASLCGALLRAGGTTKRKVEKMDEELEFMGASLESGIDLESGSISLSILSKDLDKGLNLFFEMLTTPNFDKKKLEIEKAKIIETIRRRNDDPFQIARREFRKLLYGSKHPLSRTQEIPFIKKISRKDLFNFYQQYYFPNNMMIAISGDFSSKEIIQKLENYFSFWKKEKKELAGVFSLEEKERFLKKTRGVGFAEKKINQASILIGQLGIKRHNPDRFALEVLNEILGGSSSSRLYKEVRSRSGLAYWVGSSFSEPYDYGIIAAGCQTKSETLGQAIRSIFKQVESLRDSLVSEEELKTAKDALINSFVFRYNSSHAIVTQKMNLDYFGFAKDYLETYTQKIEEITASQLLEVARKYLKPEEMTLMAVGEEASFDVPLKEFGTVKPIDLKINE
ncbi:MAG: insulinase family protein [Elusimicrobia bacterium]|nr:insulinase family protein [Elusimicrobiota bacterium]